MTVIKARGILAGAVMCVLVGIASVSNGATILAEWTFEASVPTTAGPHTAEGGIFAGSSQALGGTNGTWSNPAGNGSPESFSSSGWDVDDFIQFQTSSLGYKQLTLSFDATSSNTGPRDFKVQASTDGTTFNDIGFTYAALANSAPNPVWNSSTGSPIYTVTTSLPSSLDNLASIWVRLVQATTTSANGGTVAAAGTSRVDNVAISGLVPEPGSATLLLLASVSITCFRRRRG